jgi:ubiquitin C-terminal hydrolase
METEIQLFIQQKHLLNQADKDCLTLLSRPNHKLVGLFNSGATCYLNSVLQCLLQVVELVNALKTSEYDSSPIVKELKRLFNYLLHSSKHAVKTTDLQAAFGWNGSQKNEQHDAHEFYGALLTALGEAGLEKSLEGIFQGQSTGNESFSIAKLYT